ncbi:DNA recombinase [Geobacillus thermoleovorans]|uniref:DNA-invertase n=2 Tax=Geobacillus TaxID=129337 RepID=A0A1Q5TA00_9BACL|nr:MULTISPECIES: recombinase family protein [Geobacillus]AMV11707.1 DNA recombinase [Geobacillus thermoleovorans]AUI37772.1 recombinase family protein [[Bacillus] caldolyticus]KLR73804.1 DNA recombinase [Geobacillus sp. T6]OKO97011.1 DNA-invertase [Geobacillus proteiniphilus]
MKAIYARVSTEESAQKGYSIAHQIDEAKKKAGTDQVLIYTDEGYSGEFLERPGLEKLRDDVRKGLIEAVIVYDPDRLARNLMHQLLIDDELRKNNVELIFVNGEYENTPEGKLFFSLRGAIAEFEKAKIRERTMAGRLRKAKEGKIVKDDKIYGYDYDKQTGQLVINEEEAEIVRFIFDSFIGQDRFKGINGIAHYLTEKKVPTKTGKTVWHRQVVRQILMNETYMGKRPQNKWNTEGMIANRYRKDQKVPMTLRPKEEWIYVDVPAIVTEEQFRRAQILLEQSRRRYAKTTKHKYLLSGLLRCAQCGNTMTGRYTKNWGKYYREYTDIKNTAGAKYRGCGMTVRADEIEKVVWSHLMDIFNNPDRLHDFQPERTDGNFEKAELDRLAKEIERARKGRKRLLNLVTISDDIDLEEIKEEIRRLQQREKDLTEQYAQLEQQLRALQDTKPSEHILREAIDFFMRHKDELSFETKQAIVRKAIKEIRVLDKDDIEIILF